MPLIDAIRPLAAPLALAAIGLGAAFVGIRSLLALVHREPPRRERPTLRVVSDRRYLEDDQ